MEENTLELSFEVDVSEGDEEKDRNYSLGDNDDGDLEILTPKLVKIKTQLSVECQCSRLHISMNRPGRPETAG